MPSEDISAEAIYSTAPIPTPPTPPSPIRPGGSSDSSSGSDEVKPPAGFNKEENEFYTWEGGGVIWKVFDKKTNSYVKNAWVDLYYNGKKRWYYFGEDGNMKIGWIFYNNFIYYLQVAYNDTFGAMVTGIQTIDGIVYEFSSTGELIRMIQ